MQLQLYVIRVLFSRKATPRSGSPLRGASDSICFLSAVYVVVLAEHIHSGKKLIEENERSYNNQRTDHVPKPIIRCSETVIYSSASELCTDTRRKFMIPNESGDSASNRTDDENEKTLMHRFLSVISACYQIDIIAYRGHDDNSVNAEGDKREKNEL